MRIIRKNKTVLNMVPSENDVYEGMVYVTIHAAPSWFLYIEGARGIVDLRHAKVFHKWLGERIAEAEGKER